MATIALSISSLSAALRSAAYLSAASAAILSAISAAILSALSAAILSTLSAAILSALSPASAWLFTCSAKQMRHQPGGSPWEKQREGFEEPPP